MSLQSKTVSGVKWNLLGQILKLFLYLLTTFILARLLNPEDFGLLGMATVFTSLVMVFNDFGIGSAIVQKKNVDQELLSSTFWTTLAVGCFSSLLTILLAPWVATFYREPELQPLLYVLSLSFILSSIGQVKISLLIKALQFKNVALIEIIGGAIGSSVAILMAFRGWGVWSLVLQLIITAGCVSLFAWIINPWRPSLIVRRSDIKAIFSFSSGLFGFNLLNYFSRNADYLLIGKYLGADALGIYTFAYRLMQIPLLYISNVVSRVLFPALSIIQENNAEIKKVFIQSSQAVAFITFPSMTLLSILAPEIVLVLFGSKWIEAIPLIQIFGIVGAIQSVITLNGNIYISKGKTTLLFLWGIISTSVAILFFIIGLRAGIYGVALGYAMATFLLLYPNFAIPFRLIDLKFLDFLKALRVQILLTIAVGLLVFGFAQILRNYQIHPIIILITNTIIGMVFYLLGTIKFDSVTLIRLLRTFLGNYRIIDRWVKPTLSKHPEA